VIAVLDTNILVSGFINPHGPPGRIIDLLRAGTLRLAVDDRILAEYVDVLHRSQLVSYFTVSDIGHILEYLATDSERVLALKQISGLPDPDDAPFLEVALAADVPLVTGNLKHFPLSCPEGCRIMPPAEFLRDFCASNRPGQVS